MKPFDYHTLPLNKAGLEQMIENMRADLITVIDGTDCNKEDWNITIKTDAINIKTTVEGDDWELNLPYEDGKVAHVRGMKLNDRDCLVFWMARHGNAHKALKALKSIMADFFAPDSKSAGFRIRVSNNAFLTGWLVQEKEDHYSLIQVPTWTAPGEEIQGRTPYSLDELHANEDELFINNIWFAMFKDNEGYTVRYDERDKTFYVIRKFDKPVELDYDDLACLELGPYEEVNYQGPAMTELGLLPPGQTPPAMVYSENGRQVAKIKEVFDGVTYVTYVLSHAQPGVTDQITFGREAVYGEQLLAVLTDRYTTLNEEVPHEANVKTLELLEEIKRLQAERYKQREDDGILGSKEVDSTEGKKVIVDVAVDPANLPRDAEGNVADLTPAE